MPSRHIDGMSLEHFFKDNGIRQEDLAERVGVSQGEISRIFRRKKRANPDVAMRLERETGIPASEFVFFEVAS